MSAIAAVVAVPFALHATLGVELAELANALRRVTVRVHSGDGRFDGVGAGVLWDVGGEPHVITSAHVVPRRRGDAPSIELADGTRFVAQVIARDRDADLALLAPARSVKSYPPAKIGRPKELRVGEMVVALGHPFGVNGALSVGVVHATPEEDDVLLRADIRLAPGNSGGPLATLDGAVIGINCMIVGGLGIAVPTHRVERFVRDASIRRGGSPA